MTVVMYRSPQQGRRGQRIDTRPQADHSMCSCLRRESMRVMNKALKIARLNHVLFSIDKLS